MLAQEVKNRHIAVYAISGSEVYFNNKHGKEIAQSLGSSREAYGDHIATGAAL